jgi:hypothetical protein
MYSLFYTPNAHAHTKYLQTLKQNKHTFLSSAPPPPISTLPAINTTLAERNRPQATAVTRRLNYTSFSSPVEYYNAGSRTGVQTGSRQEYTILKRQVAETTEFCTVAPNIFGSSLWNLLYSTFLAPRILRQFLEFWKNKRTSGWGLS